MSANRRVLFGPVAAALLLLGVVDLALMVPGYSHVRQTVSEIGEAGSPAQLSFTLLLCAVAACIAIFAWGLRDIARSESCSAAAAYVVGCMALSTAGVGIFSFPHPLHNVFGLSELVGYQAPLVLALTWRRAPQLGRVVRFSGIMAAVVWIAIAINLLPIFRPPAIWPYLSPIFGLVQRSLFTAWFLWAAGAGVLLARRR
jgi:hypothetical membrane protein